MISLARTASAQAEAPWTSSVSSRARVFWAALAPGSVLVSASSSSILPVGTNVSALRSLATPASSVWTKNW